MMINYKKYQKKKIKYKKLKNHYKLKIKKRIIWMNVVKYFMFKDLKINWIKTLS